MLLKKITKTLESPVENINKNRNLFKTSWWHFVIALTITLMVTLVCLLFKEKIEPVNLSMFYLAGVVFASVYLGFLPALVTSVTSVLTFDFVFVPPYWTFAVHNSEYLISFLVFILIATVISKLVASSRYKMFLYMDSSERNELLYFLNRDLSATIDSVKVVTTAMNHLSRYWQNEVMIFVPQLQQRFFYSNTDNFFTDSDRIRARDAFKNGSNDVDSTRSFIVLNTGHGVQGVIGIQGGSLQLSSHVYRFCNQMADQIAIALDRALFSEILHKSNLTTEMETLRNNLLSSIAHDLRTPATTISGYISVLDKNLKENNLDDCKLIVKNLHSESMNLNSLIENAFSITKIQSGMSQTKETIPVDEIIISAVRRVKRKLENYILSMKLDNRMIQVNGDPHLLEQMLINLLENSIKYAPEMSVIEIKTEISEQSVIISIKDEGPGIPAGEEQNIFEKFYRLKRDEGNQGTGLGLALCKAVVTLLDGEIEAQSGLASGTTILVTLPAVIDKDEIEIL